MEGTGFLANCRYLLHDRDSKYCASFRGLIEAEKVKTLALPPHSPNLNAFAERWVRSVKEECLSKLILFGERSLKRALHHYATHITENGITRAKITYCFFLREASQFRDEERCDAENGWVVCSNSMRTARHDAFE
jgi:putative transposase